jgi:hypothetical protein
MLKRMCLFLLFVLAPASAHAAETALPATPAQQIIADQLAAMARDDGAAAYAFAATEVQAKFPSPDIFMRMVRQGYAPVYKPRSYTFAGGEALSGGVIRELVDLVAADGTAWTAEYFLRPDPDGTLKIIACRLSKKAEVGA